MPGDAAPVVKIGLIGPFEGLGRPLGYELLPVVKAALAEANDGGQLGRYRVALVALNDDLDPQTAAAQAHALAQDPDLIAVLGPWTSATAAAAAPMLAQAGIPLLATAPLSAPSTGIYTLCPDPEEIYAALEAEAERLATAGSVTRVYAGDAAAAADDLIRWRVAGGEDVLIGGPDLARAWLIDQAGVAAEGTRAAVCAPAVGTTTDGALSPAARLATAGAQTLVDALAADITAHGRPTRAGVSAALAGHSVQTGLTWYQVEDGQWVEVKLQEESSP